MRHPSNKNRKKVNLPSKQKLSPTKYFILEKDERLLRYAALYLEIIGEEIHTPQQLVQEAASKHAEFIAKQHKFIYPDYLKDETPISTPEDPVE